MGCVFAIFAGVFPRLALFAVWLGFAVVLDLAHLPASGLQGRRGIA